MIEKKPTIIQLGRKTFTERNGELWCCTFEGRNYCVMNALIRVDGASVIVKNNKEVACHRGRLIYKGEEIPFEIAMSSARCHCSRLLRDCLAKTKGASLYVDGGWNQKLLNIGTLFKAAEKHSATPF